jgi:hypothetical protein
MEAAHVHANSNEPTAMHSLIRHLAAPAVLLLAACGSPSAPGAATDSAPLALDQATVTLSRPGETAAVTARGNGQITSSPSFTVAGERRYLHDQPVLDPAALAAGQLRANAPGTATLEVRAFGMAPARLEVRFLPAGPLVVAAPEAAGDTATLRGYRLNEVGADAVTVGGRAAVLAERDSATLRVVLPAAQGAACDAAAEALAVRGAEVAPGVAVRRAEGQVRLEVGQAARLAGGAAGCLRLAAVPGARYALAFLDARFVRAARGGYEGAPPSPAFYSVSVSEAGRTGGAPAASRAPRFAVASDIRPVYAGAAEDPASPYTRTSPWTEGERIVVRDPGLPQPTMARVVRVYGGHLVLALAEGEEPEGGRAAWTARADSAFAEMAAEGYPVLRAALSAGLPVTSTGSGQLLVLARRDGTSYAGSHASVAEGGRHLSFPVLNTAFGTSSAAILRTLAHELAHAWQQQYADETRPAGAPSATAAAPWAAEGSADLLAWAVVKRARGMSLAANWNWAGEIDAPANTSFALLAAASRGNLTAGYAGAAGFGLDQVNRLVRRGVSESDALALVSRGMVEGWYGFDAAGVRRTGMTERMRGRLDAAWDPADALLRWTLSQAVDDLTSNPDLQNPTFLAVSTAGASASRGWLPQAVLRSGGTAVPGHSASLATLAGNAATLQWMYGSPNYFLIEDEGVGANYKLDARWNGQPLAETEWMVVRYR